MKPVEGPQLMEKRKNIKDIILTIAVFVLAGLLVWLLYTERHERKARAEYYAEQSQKMEAGKNDVNSIEILQHFQERLPYEGIVCWGDEAAFGSRVGSVPGKLGHLVKERLFDEAIEQFVAHKATARISDLGLPVYNMGVENERIEEILARSGVKRLVAGEDFTIPSNALRVKLDIMDEDGNLMLFAEQRTSRIGEVRISGIEGFLYKGAEYDDLHFKLAFERHKRGDEVEVAKGTEIQLESAQMYRNCLPVILIEDDPERNGSPDQISASLQSILDRHSVGGTYYVVVCATEEGSACDKTLQQTFGAHYLRTAKKQKDMYESDYAQLAEEVWDCLEAQEAFGPVREDVQDTLKELDGSSDQTGEHAQQMSEMPNGIPG